MDLIQIRNLCFSYPSKKDTLKSISFNVKKGSFTCIVGENGSGKSTLLKCILGLNKAYTGDISKETHIGYLPQKSESTSGYSFSAYIYRYYCNSYIKWLDKWCSCYSAHISTSGYS